ncbi:MAG TPA: TolC family protein [Puia sp.]|nr:TolC family protein [Puia sp.]
MKHMPIVVALVSAFLLTGGILSAQDSVPSGPLTLHDAIDLSLKNSKQLRISKAKVDEATAVTRQAEDARLPDLKVSGSWLGVTQPDINVGIKAPPGSNSGGLNLSEIKVNEAAYGLANLSIPLFSGFRVRYGIQSAKFLEKAAELNAGNDREAVILNTINAYANLYKAHINVALLQENLAESKRRDSDFMNMERNGLLARNDLLKAELQTSTIEYNLVDAQEQEKIATVNMNLLLGLPEQSMLEPDTTSFQQSPQLQTIDTYEKAALQNRKDLTALHYQAKAAEADVHTAHSDYFPGIALTGGYIAADIPNLFSVYNAVTYGVGLQYNLSAFWKNGAKVDQAKARQREIAADQDLLDDNIRLQVNQAYADYYSALKKIDVSRMAIEQGEENYRITRNKYNNSLATMTDLLDANVSLLQARINLETAKADAIVAYNTLLERTGTLSP